MVKKYDVPIFLFSKYTNYIVLKERHLILQNSFNFGSNIFININFLAFQYNIIYCKLTVCIYHLNLNVRNIKMRFPPALSWKATTILI